MDRLSFERRMARIEADYCTEKALHATVIRESRLRIAALEARHRQEVADLKKAIILAESAIDAHKRDYLQRKAELHELLQRG